MRNTLLTWCRRATILRESLAWVSGMPSCNLESWGKLIRKWKTIHMDKMVKNGYKSVLAILSLTWTSLTNAF
jgi:hypothetical protein